ncbi:hypothetical protein BK144_23400, partial [Paenibacillus sp. FSL R7-0273]
PVKCPIPFILLLYLVYIFVGEDSNFFRGLWRNRLNRQWASPTKGKNPLKSAQPPQTGPVRGKNPTKSSPPPANEPH